MIERRATNPRFAEPIPATGRSSLPGDCHEKVKSGLLSREVCFALVTAAAHTRSLPK